MLWSGFPFSQKGDARGRSALASNSKANIGITYLQSNVLLMNRKLPNNVTHDDFMDTDVA